MSSSSDETVFTGKIGEVVHSKQPDGRVFEQFRRPPGTRLVIVSPDNKILVTHENRLEHGGDVDLRLPGGKVCDTIEEYRDLLNSGADLAQAAQAGAAKEALEETGLIIKNPELITVAKAGATVDWDLYYFLVRDYTENSGGQQLEEGENIRIDWMTAAELQTAITKGQMHEWRSVGVLLGMVLPNLKPVKPA